MGYHFVIQPFLYKITRVCGALYGAPAASARQLYRECNKKERDKIIFYTFYHKKTACSFDSPIERIGQEGRPSEKERAPAPPAIPGFPPEKAAGGLRKEGRAGYNKRYTECPQIAAALSTRNRRRKARAPRRTRTQAGGSGRKREDAEKGRKEHRGTKKHRGPQGGGRLAPSLSCAAVWKTEKTGEKSR